MQKCAEVLFEPRRACIFYIGKRLSQNQTAGQTDFVEKTSADERKAYKRTPREETALANKNELKEENRRFSTLNIKTTKENGRALSAKPFRSFFCLRLSQNQTAPYILFWERY